MLFISGRAHTFLHVSPRSFIMFIVSCCCIISLFMKPRMINLSLLILTFDTKCIETSPGGRRARPGQFDFISIGLWVGCGGGGRRMGAGAPTLPRPPPAFRQLSRPKVPWNCSVVLGLWVGCGGWGASNAWGCPPPCPARLPPVASPAARKYHGTVLWYLGFGRVLLGGGGA